MRIASPAPTRSSPRAKSARGLASLLAFLLLAASLAAADPPVPAVAPPDHAVLATMVNGWIFAPQKLKQEYDQLLGRLDALQADIDAGKLTAAQAQRELAEVRGRLETLRRDLDRSKVRVDAGRLHEQTEELEFELGPERRLALTANQVRVVGWDKPHVRCELRRQVLTVGDESPVKHLDAIRLKHARARAEFAGQTAEEIAEQERQFLAGDGARLNAEQRASRQALVDQIAGEKEIYAAFRARPIDQVTVTGLEYSENESIVLAAQSDGGEGRYAGVRRRYASLTVFVPRCSGVCVRGAMRGVLIENLAAPLVLVGEDYTDEDVRGRFEIRGVQGDVTVRSLPLRVIENVEGQVAVQGTQDFGAEGGGTSRVGDLRDMRPYAPLQVSVRDVRGGATLAYGRVKLELRGMAGPLDVRNDFGDTRLLVDKPLADAPHRLLSQAGRIDVQFAAEPPPSLDLVATTNHGSVRTNLSANRLKEFHLISSDVERTRLNWNGFRTVQPDEGPLATFNLIGRFSAVLAGKPRKPGLDLISRGGTISVTRTAP